MMRPTDDQQYRASLLRDRCVWSNGGLCGAMGVEEGEKAEVAVEVHVMCSAEVGATCYEEGKQRWLWRCM
jgi:hypothetical protein